jgi:hypothetical protein
MSLEDYKKLDAERIAEGKKANEHYKSVDLPGQRTMDSDVTALRARIAAMKAERAKPIN